MGAAILPAIRHCRRLRCFRAARAHRGPPPVRGAPLSAPPGRAPAAQEVAEAIADNEPWLLHTPPAAPGGAAAAVDRAASALLRGEIVAWFDGRSEIGARALGHRSILADPRRAEAHFEVNVEAARAVPAACAVGARRARRRVVQRFARGGGGRLGVHAAHCIGARGEPSARDHPRRRQRAAADCRRGRRADVPRTDPRLAACGVPLVLNTSFNLAGEPIVDSPADAIRSFSVLTPRSRRSSWMATSRAAGRFHPRGARSRQRTRPPSFLASLPTLRRGALGRGQADGVWLELRRHRACSSRAVRRRAERRANCGAARGGGRHRHRGRRGAAPRTLLTAPRALDSSGGRVSDPPCWCVNFPLA